LRKDRQRPPIKAIEKRQEKPQIKVREVEISNQFPKQAIAER
jgi:hypothetical protein